MVNELPEERVKQVEAGLALFQKAQAEVERLTVELKTAKETITRQNVELEELRRVNNILESTAKTHQIERDQAVADRVAYETLFSTIMAQLRIFKIPEPLTTVIENLRMTGAPYHSSVKPKDVLTS
jgi:FtsZ-binding cell division protein ZapB